MSVERGKALFDKAPLWINERAYQSNAKLKYLTIPDTVVQIRSQAFAKCVNLKTVKMGAGVTSIESHAFSQCSSLRSIVIPHGVKSIGKHAFAGCTRLTFIVLPSTVVTVGIGAFSGCEHLVVAAIPNPATVIELLPERQPQQLADGIFSGCPRLQYVIAPALVGDPGMHFENTPLMVLGFEGRLVDDTPDSRRRVSELQFWSRSIHKLCTAGQQEWVKEVLLIGLRLGSPSSVWVAVIGNIRTCELLEYHKSDPAPPKKIPFLTKGAMPRTTFSSGLQPNTASFGAAHPPKWGTPAPPKKFTFPTKGELGAYGIRGSGGWRSAEGTSRELKQNRPQTSNEPIGVGEVCVAGNDTASSSKSVFQTEMKPFAKLFEEEGSRSLFGPLSKKSAPIADAKVLGREDVAIHVVARALDVQQCFGQAPPFSVVIPENVTQIAACAFAGCAGLKSVTIHGKVAKIGRDAFNACVGLTTVDIPPGVTHIEASAFAGCKALRSINLPSSIRTIGANAFSGCEQLTSIDLPHGVESIGNGAFMRTGLESVSIPSTMSTIKKSLFASCCSLSSVIFASVDHPSSIRRIGAYAFIHCAQLKSIDLPNGVKTIGMGAFMRSGLKSVSIPSTMSIIEKELFAECPLLTSVTIPSGITTIEESAFRRCSRLASVSVPPSVLTIAPRAFEECSALRAIEFPDAMTTVERRVLANCTSLLSVSFPGATKIGVGALLGCKSLLSVEIPKDLSEIGGFAFSECHSLRFVELPKVTKICRSAFAKCTALESIALQPGLAEVGFSAFSGCSNLRYVDLPSGTIRIAASAFEDCTSLGHATFPSGLVEVGTSAFSGCASLTSAILPDTVTVVGDRAFAFCHWLITASVRNPAVVLETPQWNEGGVFVGCVRLQYALAPAMMASAKTHFKLCPALTNGGLVEDSALSRHRASELTFWSTLTHPLCSPPRRACVRVTLLCAGRLSNQGLHLPPEMWTSILGLVRVHELGPNGYFAKFAKLTFQGKANRLPVGRLFSAGLCKPKDNLKFVGKKQRPQIETAADKSDSGLKKASEKPKLFERYAPNLVSPSRGLGSAVAAGSAESDTPKTSGLWQSKSGRKTGGFLSNVESQSDAGAGVKTTSSLWNRSKLTKGAPIFKQRPQIEAAADKSDSGLKKAEGASQGFKGFTTTSEKPELLERFPVRGDASGRPNLVFPPRGLGSAVAAGSAESDTPKTSGLWQSKSGRKTGGFLSNVESQSDAGAGVKPTSSLWNRSKLTKGAPIFKQRPQIEAAADKSDSGLKKAEGFKGFTTTSEKPELLERFPPRGDAPGRPNLVFPPRGLGSAVAAGSAESDTPKTSGLWQNKTDGFHSNVESQSDAGSGDNTTSSL